MLLFDQYIYEKIHFIISINHNSFYIMICTSILLFLMGLVTYLKKRTSMITKNFFLLSIFLSFIAPLLLLSYYEVLYFRIIEILIISIIPYLLIKFSSIFPVYTKPEYTNIKKNISFFYTISFVVIYLLFELFNLGKVVNDFYFTFKFFTSISILFGIFSSIYFFSLNHKNNVEKIKNRTYLLILGVLISFSSLFLINTFSIVFNKYFILIYNFFIPFTAVFSIISVYLIFKQKMVLSFNYSKWIMCIFYLFLEITMFNILIMNLSGISKKNLFILNFFNIISILGAIFVFDFLIYKLKYFSPKNQHLRNKLDFFQTISIEKYYTDYAKLIGDMIHRVAEINGVCVILNINGIYNSVYQTNIFKEMNKFKLINQFKQMETKLSIDNSPLYMSFNKNHLVCFPLTVKHAIQGAILIGEKTDHTMFSAEELNILGEIVLNSSQLILSAVEINHNEERIMKTYYSEKNMNHFKTELENERKKLSLFLHDEILQSLIIQLNYLRMIERNKNISVHDLEGIDNQLESIVQDIRKMCKELYPIIVEDLGLEASINELKRNIEINHNIVVHNDFNYNSFRISKGLEIQLYRVIKELMFNAIKHSNCNNIYIKFTEDNNKYICYVQDDGNGFKIPTDFPSFVKNNHMGLASIHQQIRELNGSIRISSGKEFGTIVTFTIPLNELI